MSVIRSNRKSSPVEIKIIKHSSYNIVKTINIQTNGLECILYKHEVDEMKIGMFTDTWYPTMDGVVNSIIQFRKSLEDRGHEVFVFAPGKEDRVDPKDDHVFRFKSKTFSMYPDYRLAFYPSKRVNDLIIENDIDVLHNHAVAFMGIKAMIASRLLQKPVIFNFHTWVTDALHYYPVNLHDDVLTKLSWIYLKYLLKNSDAIIAPSKPTLNELQERCPDMSYSKAIAPGVDRTRYHQDVDGSSIIKDMGLEGSDVLLHVGRISKEKNLDLILNALPLIKEDNGDVQLLIVGDGPAKEYYEDHVEQKGLEDNVTFTGFVPEDKLPKYYAAADSFLIASRFETLGIVILEALATGTVVAGIDSGVIPKIVEEGKNGFLFKEDKTDCAHKIMSALENRDMVKENGGDIPFNNRMAGEELVDLYKKAIKKKKEKISN